MATVAGVFKQFHKMVTKLEKIKDNMADIMKKNNDHILYLNRLNAEAQKEQDLAIAGILAIDKILPKGA